jgi:hypothetical protein
MRTGVWSETWRYVRSKPRDPRKHSDIAAPIAVVFMGKKYDSDELVGLYMEPDEVPAAIIDGDVEVVKMELESPETEAFALPVDDNGARKGNGWHRRVRRCATVS